MMCLKPFAIFAIVVSLGESQIFLPTDDRNATLEVAEPHVMTVTLNGDLTTSWNMSSNTEDLPYDAGSDIWLLSKDGPFPSFMTDRLPPVVLNGLQVRSNIQASKLPNENHSNAHKSFDPDMFFVSYADPVEGEYQVQNSNETSLKFNNSSEATHNRHNSSSNIPLDNDVPEVFLIEIPRRVSSGFWESPNLERMEVIAKSAIKLNGNVSDLHLNNKDYPNYSQLFPESRQDLSYNNTSSYDSNAPLSQEAWDVIQQNLPEILKHIGAPTTFYETVQNADTADKDTGESHIVYVAEAQNNSNGNSGDPNADSSRPQYFGTETVAKETQLLTKETGIETVLFPKFFLSPFQTDLNSENEKLALSRTYPNRNQSVPSRDKDLSKVAKSSVNHPYATLINKEGFSNGRQIRNYSKPEVDTEGSLNIRRTAETASNVLELSKEGSRRRVQLPETIPFQPTFAQLKDSYSASMNVFSRKPPMRFFRDSNDFVQKDRIFQILQQMGSKSAADKSNNPTIGVSARVLSSPQILSPENNYQLDSERSGTSRNIRTNDTAKKFPKKFVPHPYVYGYDQIDDAGTTQHRQETADGNGTVKGSYGYRDANGVYRRVSYIADHKGFRAFVQTNEPGTTNTSSPHVVVNAESPPANISSNHATKPKKMV